MILQLPLELFALYMITTAGIDYKIFHQLSRCLQEKGQQPQDHCHASTSLHPVRDDLGYIMRA